MCNFYKGSLELIFDSEPPNVRTEMFRLWHGKYPSHSSEFHTILVKNISEIIGEIVSRGYGLYYKRDAIFAKGTEKKIIYYTGNLSMISIMIQSKRSTAEPGQRISLSDWDPFDSKQDDWNNDGRRFYFISMQTMLQSELDWFNDLLNRSRIEEETKDKLFIIKSMDYGIELDSFNMQHIDCDIELNYGSHFKSVHEKIVKSLKNKMSGLYIFHGPPGTGKTSYIRHLTTQIDNRRFVMVPNALVATLFSPKMISDVYSLKDCVLVLEDSELAVFQRDGTNNELVSGMLNITDGLLKDLLNISIIVTFNSSKIEELDKALLRKGRLKGMYKFDSLSVSDSQILLEKLGKSHQAAGPMTLADIYNIDENIDFGGNNFESSPGFAMK